MIPEINSIMSAGPKADPKEVAAKVQGMFMEVMLKAMEESVDAEDGLFGNSASSDIYRGMLREHLASAMSEKLKSPLESVLGSKMEDKIDHGPRTMDRVTTEESILPVNGVVSSPQGWRRDPINGETKYHAGTDIAAPSGTPIHAVAAGKVIESGVKNGYGNTIVVETEDGRKMLYAHNKRNFVQVGDWVSRGEPIAEVGSTGRATGPHVHFEVNF
jgi:murein DD-endopeptidase MepM/ murein hydrolase activator NlpD